MILDRIQTKINHFEKNIESGSQVLKEIQIEQEKLSVRAIAAANQLEISRQQLSLLQEIIEPDAEQSTQLSQAPSNNAVYAHLPVGEEKAISKSDLTLKLNQAGIRQTPHTTYCELKRLHDAGAIMCNNTYKTHLWFRKET